MDLNTGQPWEENSWKLKSLEAGMENRQQEYDPQDTARQGSGLNRSTLMNNLKVQIK